MEMMSEGERFRTKTKLSVQSGMVVEAAILLQSVRYGNICECVSKNRVS